MHRKEAHTGPRARRRHFRSKAFPAVTAQRRGCETQRAVSALQQSAEAYQKQLAEMIAEKASRGWWPYERGAGACFPLYVHREVQNRASRQRCLRLFKKLLAGDVA